MGIKRRPNAVSLCKGPAFSPAFFAFLGIAFYA
jgi:hypothetical protein